MHRKGVNGVLWVAEGAWVNSPDGGDRRRRLLTIHTARVGGKCECAVRLQAGNPVAGAPHSQSTNAQMSSLLLPVSNSQLK